MKKTIQEIVKIIKEIVKGIIISILVFVVGILLLRASSKIINKYTLENFKFYVQMLGVDKDIVISEWSYSTDIGGYATSSYGYFIDLDKKKIYKILDYYVYGVATKNGEWGHHYSIKGTKDLSDEEINDVLKLTEIEQSSNSNSNSSLNDIFSDRTIYYTIKYKNKTTTISEQTASPLVKILNSIKSIET